MQTVVKYVTRFFKSHPLVIILRLFAPVRSYKTTTLVILPRDYKRKHRIDPLFKGNSSD